ncbi:hypothetical protein VTH06DRAFT_4234 [Thermothelomyces fergusii]
MDSHGRQDLTSDPTGKKKYTELTSKKTEFSQEMRCSTAQYPCNSLLARRPLPPPPKRNLADPIGRSPISVENVVGYGSRSSARAELERGGAQTAPLRATGSEAGRRRWAMARRILERRACGGKKALSEIPQSHRALSKQLKP